MAMDSETTLKYNKCQTIYQNLIDCHKDRSGVSLLSSLYVKEFQETGRCDQFSDFSSHRNDLKRKINESDPHRVDRIMKCEETIMDDKFAASACVHYNKFHQLQLVKALSWPNYVYYQTVERAERIVAFIGIFGAGYGTLQVVRNSVAAIKIYSQKM